MRTPYANPAPLDELELTGRTASHVHPCELPPCTLHRDTLDALLAMRRAALADGIDLLDRNSQPLSATALEPAERVAAILVWSALPGASRHHWGSDFDVIDGRTMPPPGQVALLGADFAAGGRYVALNDWLGKHAADFGFYRPYDLDRGGVQPEPWHLSFAPLAEPALAAMTPDLLRAALSQAPLAGANIVLERLPELFERYVAAVAEAPRDALYAAALSRASRPV
jgi:hypothetical protein